MAKGTTFGTTHSSTDLNLIQQKVEIGAAVPKTNIIDIPGSNGSKDLTEALGVGVVYADREIKWTFALYPGADWPAVFSAVSNALSGRACHIVLDEDPAWYYDGRVSVEEHTSDKLLRRIKVTAICRPYKRKVSASTVTRSDLTTSYKTMNLQIGSMPLIPEITVEQETTLKWGDLVITVNEGTHILPALRMTGTQEVKAKLTSGSVGTISVSWREGSL